MKTQYDEKCVDRGPDLQRFLRRSYKKLRLKKSLGKN